MLTAIAFSAQGGLVLERTTYTEIALMLGGALVCATALVRHGFARPSGGWALLGVAGLAALTALSIVWSFAPSDSWEEANRTFAYLAVFATGLALVRLAPRAWPGLLHGIAAACVAVCGYALATKVFPAALAEEEVFARLREPFGYWNAVGLMAALGVPPLLWLAARRTGHAAANALAWPGLGLLLTTLMLSYSRGALLALLVGLIAWFALVPLRLRAALPLLAATLGAALPITWAFTQDDLTTDRLPIEVRIDAGHELGVLLVIMVLVLLAAGLMTGFYVAQRPPSARARFVAGRALLVAIALISLGGVVKVATAPGGLSKQWDELTNPAARTPANTPDRLLAASSVRARYWREAFSVHAESPWVGTGAGAYATARTRFRNGPLEVRHAHGYAVQTLADLGWAGLVLSLAALAAWLSAALGATGLRRRADRELPWDSERIGLVTLGVVVVVFGVHSFVDWTWFIPANAAVALVAAGWVAGRGPLADGPVALPVVAGPRHNPAPALIAAGIAAVAALAAWAAFQPVRSVHAGDTAIGRLQDGQFDAAASIAQIGVKRNPLSVEPLFELSAMEDARGRKPAALAALRRAVRLQPANAETWRRLGRYQLSVLGAPREALPAFRAAYFLDPQSPEAVSDFLEVQRAINAPPVAP